MNKKTFLVLSMLTTLSSTAQEIVSTQGDSYSTGTGNIDFTIGEVVINTGTDGTNYLTQGFHQTNWNFVGIVDHIPDFDVSVYPNPTSDLLNIKTNSFENVSYSLIDGQGKLVLQGELSSESTSIQVDQLQIGKYSIVLTNSSQNLKTINLIKVN